MARKTVMMAMTMRMPSLFRRINLATALQKPILNNLFKNCKNKTPTKV